LPLNMNGLNGRMLKIPAKNKKTKKEILFIAGQHTSIERISGICEYLSQFGNVTSPDLPGFGGMEPFYKVNKKPSIDNMADYLASFIKLRYRNKRLTIIAISYGFAVVTRMLQKYPELSKKVDLLFSVSGLVNKKDFRWKRHNIFVMKNGSRLLSLRAPARLATLVAVRGPVIRSLYRVAEKKHPKLRDAKPEVRDQRIDFEIGLWKANDFRTWMATCVSMFSIDLRNRPVDLPVYHYAVDEDHYFDSVTVEQSMRSIYRDFIKVKGVGGAHAPSVIATSKDAEYFIPPQVRKLLRQRSKV